ncbi:hypothetical protein A4S05_35575 [Nostoc sp. KVJ20]|nr:hypothetical protein A4S05_35575 [Nostoc sp. KVJ20]
MIVHLSLALDHKQPQLFQLHRKDVESKLCLLLQEGLGSAIALLKVLALKNELIQVKPLLYNLILIRA